ncbi:MAG: SufD family Fe-S cluster assembly protein [Candidatus Diapherotrites archaeon]
MSFRQPFFHLREKATAALCQLSVPSSRYGLDIFLPSPKLTSFSSASDASFRFFQEKDGVVMMDFHTALEKFPDMLSSLASLLDEEDYFEMHHLASIENGLLIWVNEHVSPAQPFSIPSLPLAVSHILLIASSHSRITCVYSPSPLSSSPSSSVIEIVASPYSHVDFVSMSPSSPSSFHFSLRKSSVSYHASVNWYWVESGASLLRTITSSSLIGERASSKDIGLILGHAENVLDVHQSAYHSHPSTKSQILLRGTLDDYSKCVYHGLLHMIPSARGSVGHQRADFLLLSPHAEVDPVPSLEIEGSDVHCSHAATIGRLDKEKLFYLSSRGLDAARSRSLYISGFITHLLSHFPDSISLDVIRSIITSTLPFFDYSHPMDVGVVA